MSTLVPYAAQIIPRTRRTGATSFVYCYERGSEIHTDQRDAATTAYALIEALGTPLVSDETSQTITAGLDRLFVAPTEDAGPAPSFDTIVSDINTALKEASAIPQLNAVLVCIQGDTVAVAHTGRAEAHMSRGRSFLRITESLPQTTPNKRQPVFSEVATGSIKRSDKLLLATPGLLHHISVEQLKNSLVDNTPGTAAEKLARLVDGKPDANRSAAVIIEIAEPQYLAEFAHGGQTTIVDIAAKESLVDVAKQSSKPVITSITNKSSRAAKHFGAWASGTAWPSTKKAARATGRSLQSTYRKLRQPKNSTK